MVLDTGRGRERTLEDLVATAQKIAAAVESVIDGKAEAVKLALTVLLAEGHLLIEDVPGVGKTMLAKALARSIDGSVRRIQFTPDLLPSDVTGVSAYNQEDHDAVPLQSRVLAQAGRDGDPARLVRSLVGGAGEEDAAVVPHRLGGDRRGAQCLGDPLELPVREDVQAALLPLRDHDSPGEFVTVLRRQEEAPFLVQPGRVSTEEHPVLTSNPPAGRA